MTVATLAPMKSQLRAEVDCIRLVKAHGSKTQPFGHYVRARCLNPDHSDLHPTMLVYPDGAYCPACGYRADALQIYQQFYPDVSTSDAVRQLIENPALQRVDEEDTEDDEAEPQYREIDPQAAVTAHLALADHPAAVAGLRAFGFTLAAIRHFRLGWATTLVRLEPEEVTDGMHLEWRWIRGERIPYQRQWRYTVPVYHGKYVRQILYRAAPGALGSKITMVAGAGSWLYNVDSLKDTETGLFVEGWGDVISCWQWGFAAAASTNGAGHWRSEWAHAYDRVKRLYVSGDADKAGQRMVAKIKQTLPWARPLPLVGDYGSRQDLRDKLLSGYTRSDFIKLLRRAELQTAWNTLQRTAK